MPLRQLKSAAGGIPQLVALGFQRGQALGGCRTGPSRLDHRLATFLGPDLGEVTKEASRESLVSTDRPTIQITRLAWLPLGRFADFSCV
jgi:hypothetical protein